MKSETTEARRARVRSSRLLAAARYHDGQKRSWSDAIEGPPPANWIRKHREWAQACREAANAEAEPRRDSDVS